MSGYFSVGNTSDSLSFYVWADNKHEASRMVDALYGPIAPQQLRVTQIKAEDVPEGDEVMNEPQLEKEARTDGYDVEDAV